MVRSSAFIPEAAGWLLSLCPPPLSTSSAQRDHSRPSRFLSPAALSYRFPGLCFPVLPLGL